MNFFRRKKKNAESNKKNPLVKPKVHTDEREHKSPSPTEWLVSEQHSAISVDTTPIAAVFSKTDDHHASPSSRSVLLLEALANTRWLIHQSNVSLNQASSLSLSDPSDTPVLEDMAWPGRSPSTMPHLHWGRPRPRRRTRPWTTVDRFLSPGDPWQDRTSTPVPVALTDTEDTDNESASVTSCGPSSPSVARSSTETGLSCLSDAHMLSLPARFGENTVVSVPCTAMACGPHDADKPQEALKQELNTPFDVQPVYSATCSETSDQTDEERMEHESTKRQQDRPSLIPVRSQRLSLCGGRPESPIKTATPPSSPLSTRCRRPVSCHVPRNTTTYDNVATTSPFVSHIPKINTRRKSESSQPGSEIGQIQPMVPRTTRTQHDSIQQQSLNPRRSLPHSKLPRLCSNRC